jgi:acylphosphatase
MVQVHVFYSGIVQGVGFRFTVQRYAAEAGLVGWVRNLRDGRVELLVEGKMADIDDFLKKVEQHFEGSIANKERQDAPASGEFDSFLII